MEVKEPLRFGYKRVTELQFNNTTGGWSEGKKKLTSGQRIRMV